MRVRSCIAAAALLFAADCSHATNSALPPPSSASVVRADSGGGYSQYLSDPLLFVSLHSAGAVEVHDLAQSGQPVVATLSATTPNGIAVDTDGTVYVADSGANAVEIYAPGETTPSKSITGLTSPQGVALDANGNLYVTDRSAVQRVLFYAKGSTAPQQSQASSRWKGLGQVALTPNGAWVFFTDSYAGTMEMAAGLKNSFFQQILDAVDPSGIAIDPATGYRYVSDVKNLQVYAYTPKNALSKTIDTGFEADFLSIGAFNGNDALFVPDAQGAIVRVYDPVSGSSVADIATGAQPSGVAYAHVSVTTVPEKLAFDLSALSSATQSVTSVVNGTTGGVTPVGPTAPACSTASSGKIVCSVTVNLQPGVASTVKLQTTANADGSGALLASGAVNVTPTIGGTNSASVLMRTIATKMVTSMSPSSLREGFNTHIVFSATLYDAAGVDVTNLTPLVGVDKNGQTDPITADWWVTLKNNSAFIHLGTATTAPFSETYFYDGTSPIPVKSSADGNVFNVNATIAYAPAQSGTGDIAVQTKSGGALEFGAAAHFNASPLRYPYLLGTVPLAGIDRSGNLLVRKPFELRWFDQSGNLTGIMQPQQGRLDAAVLGGDGRIYVKGVQTDANGNCQGVRYAVFDASARGSATALRVISESGSWCQGTLLATDAAGDMFVSRQAEIAVFDGADSGANLAPDRVIATSGLVTLGAADLGGDLYYVDNGSNEEVPAGGTSPTPFMTGKNLGMSMVVDANGRLWILAGHGTSQRVSEFDPASGTLLRRISGDQTMLGQGTTLAVPREP